MQNIYHFYTYLTLRAYQNCINGKQRWIKELFALKQLIAKKGTKNFLSISKKKLKKKLLTHILPKLVHFETHLAKNLKASFINCYWILFSNVVFMIFKYSEKQI